MKSELEIRERLINLKDKLNSIITNGETEKRELTEDETNKMAELRNQIDEAENELKAIEQENRKLAETQLNNKNKENKKMETRLFDLIKGICDGNLTDEQRAYVKGNTISIRADREGEGIQATTDAYGKENVPTDKTRLEVEIRNASVLSKIGATWFPNAVGDIKIPKYNGSNVAWAESENADAADGVNTFSEVTLSPKRLTAYITISRQFLAQSPEDAEAILIADLAAAVAEKLDETIFGEEEGTSAQPAGLFYGATGSTTLSDISYDSVLDLETEVEEKNGNDYIFVTAPGVKQALRGTQMASGLEMVYNHGEIDGRKAVVSNSVVKGGLLCMDPRDLAVASWDGMNIIVDPYTLAGKNQIKVTVNYLVDAALKGERIAATKFDDK